MVENYLKECLDYAMLKELPPIWDGKETFHRAICRCKMATGMIDYLIVGIDDDLNIFGAKAFGISMIYEYMDVYPYDWGKDSITDEIVKVNPSDIMDNQFVGEWGVIGIENAEQAYDWVVSHRKTRGAVSRKPEKLKENIKEILSSL